MLDLSSKIDHPGGIPTNVPVASSKPTCIVCVKHVGSEMCFASMVESRLMSSWPRFFLRHGNFNFDMLFNRRLLINLAGKKLENEHLRPAINPEVCPSVPLNCAYPTCGRTQSSFGRICGKAGCDTRSDGSHHLRIKWMIVRPPTSQ